MRTSWIWITPLVCLLALGALWSSGKPAYHRYQESVAFRRATNFLAHGQLREAALSARQVLAGNPTHVEACIVLAELAELSGSPQVLDWRRRIAGLSATLEHQLQLAASALRVQPPPYPLASEILRRLATAGSNDVSYCNLSAEVAIKSGRRQEAENWFEHASSLQPSNKLHQLNLAVLRLGSTNPASARQARARLNDLSADPNLAVPALRSLLGDCLIRHEVTNAKVFSVRLLAQPSVQFSDRLDHLEILAQLNPAEVEAYLGAIQGPTFTNAALAADACSALIRSGLADQARRWLTNYPPELLATHPLQMARAECAFALKDWTGLERTLRGANWGDFEPMRVALLSQAAFECGDKQVAKLRWQLAVKQAYRKLGSLLWLLAKADAWGRTSLRIQLLWELSHQFPAEQWALGDLGQHYLSRGDTRGLHDVYAQRLRITPTEREARNNFATTGLLLGTNLPSVHRTARELFSECPHDPIFASTFAYSLHVQGRTQEGLAILERLDAESLARPGIALYYGALLAAGGQPIKAEKYFSLARVAELLPEERRLLPPLASSLPSTQRPAHRSD